MIGSVGLAAAYPGFQQAQHADLQNDTSALQLENARIEQAGTEALGRTIQAFQQASMPGAMPMPQAAQPAPNPGQPSEPRPMAPQGPAMGGGYLDQQPMTPRPQPFQPGSVSAPPEMQSQGFQPPGAPAGGGLAALQGKLDLKTLMAAIAQANPGAKPAVIAAAVNKALPLLNTQAQMDWKQMSLALAGGRLANAQEGTRIREEQGGQRLQQGAQRLEQQAGEYGSRAERRQAQTEQGGKRLEIQGNREARLAAQAQVRQDQRWQQLELQRQQLQTRIQQGGDRTAISQWRAIVDAQHKRAIEIIQANSINSGMDPKDKKALIDEQNKFYDSQIKDMRSGQGNSTGRPAAADTTGQPEKPKTEERVPQGGAIPGSPTASAAPRPQAVNPKTGAKVEWDGQAWVPVQ